jgi:putative PIN family toxin of toxin-antitoxin system
MQIVLDTNVLVSGLLNPDGAPGRVLDLILAGKLKILYDDRIIAEYSDVLARPQFGFSRDLTDAVMGYLRLSGFHVTALPMLEGLSPDPEDNPFAEVAITGSADVLVTGNQRHFSELAARGIRVVSPDAMLTLFRQQ